jgi:uncharacterized repeat protein (TIGR01451 family)
MSAARIRKARNTRRPLALEAMEPRQLLAILMVTNNGDSGPGSLRQAITDANTNTGGDTIRFNLPSGQLTISPLTPLPTLTDSGTLIDGTSQPNFNTTTGRPSVILTGSQLPANSQGSGITITGGNCTVKGLVINSFGGITSAGITISGSPGDLVQDCYIGTSANGLSAAGNGGDGIDVGANNCTIGGSGVLGRNVISGNTFTGIKVTANRTTIQGNYVGLGADGTTVVQNFSGIDLGNTVGNQIGGTAAGVGNVISGNVFDGIDISSGGVTSDVIQGNFIGTDATGTQPEQAVASITNGISISGGAGNTIGGIGAAGNVISGNSQAAIVISGSTAQNNVVAGNLIGVAANGTAPVANKGAGVSIINGAHNNVIGGASAVLGNVIANNGSGNNVAGVNVQSGTSIEIDSNSIHDNANGGIKLGTGANGNQPAPVLTKAQTAAGQTEVVGSLAVNPATGAGDLFIIQFFANQTADAKGLFEGQTFLGQVIVQADVNGNATFDAHLPTGTTVGYNVTATATQQQVLNTSQFSTALPVTAAPTTDLKVSVQASPNPALLGNNVTYVVTVTNAGTNDDTNVVYTGTIDNNSTFVSAQASQLADPTVPPTFANNVITAALGTIKAGKSATVTIVVTPIDTGNVSLQSSVTGDLIDTNTANNSVTTTVPVNPSADVAVTIDSSPNPVAVGGSLAYVVTIVNNGPSIASGVTATDTLPASVTINDVAPSQGSFNEAGNVLTFDVGDIPIQGSVTITITVTPNQDGSIVDTASASSPTVADPNTNNNSASNTTKVEKAVNLALGVVSTPNPAVVGSNLTYTITTTNNTGSGATPSDATGAILTDQLPAGVDLVSVNVPTGGHFTVTNGLVTVNLPTIPANTPNPPVVTIVVKPKASGTYVNTASITDNVEINTNTTNTTVTTTTLANPSDLVVTVEANPSPATVGAPLTYVVTVTNFGPSAAPGVVLVDQLPAAIKAGATSITKSQGTFSLSGSRITADLGTIANGKSATLTIVVVPTLSGPLSDVAGAASLNVDPNTANNMVTSSILVSPSDLIVSGVTSSATPIQGDPYVYAFTVFNAGPAAAPNAAVNVTLPTNATYVTSSASQGFTGLANGVLSAAFGTLAPNTSATVFVTVIPTSTGSFVAQGTTFSGNFDPNTGNNSVSISRTATNFPGTFVLSSTGYSGAETAGNIPIRISRLNGTLGAIDVSFTTVPGTAVPGVNYTTMSGTVVFPAGATSETILVPVRHDNTITPNLTFTFAVTGVDNGATLGAPAAATVTIINVDRDLVPPEVLAVVPVESGNAVTAYVVDFSKPLDPTHASFAGNYTLFASGRDLGTANAFIGVASASYNAANNSVTLTPATHLKINAFYGLMINGNAASPDALTDLSGNVLDGDGNGVAGGNYGAYIGIGNNLNYIDSGGNAVNLAVMNGQMLVTRNFAGDPYELEMLGVVPGSTVLGGSVRRIGFSSGVTTFGELDGLGPFGSVRSNLTTPPFYVGKSVFNAPMPVPQSVATAQAIGMLVPNGPRYVMSRLG